MSGGFGALLGAVSQGSSASGIQGYDTLDGGRQTVTGSAITIGGSAESLIPIAIAAGLGLGLIALVLYVRGK